ncbi:PREDICTED: uncharacterized protein LOC104823982 isoform X3 [Tarenaya hassleriana]|uniref:uncharacterized protein LOC104823982 isoform X3 n=1 Tax=Tarenaya hassleriana TaxID=28532 RepID=UPI00053C584F|nr:PREDICTED: uncharacterized protein LOC104823982 isoform X3 [Tarenaya hassleriana]
MSKQRTSATEMAGIWIHTHKTGISLRFLQTPPAWSRSSTAVFRYEVQRPDRSDACKNEQCSFVCQLDGQILRQCPASVLVLKNLTVNQQHELLVKVKTSSRVMNSSAHSWFIDTIPPTARLSSSHNYTNGKRISVDVTFSEPCRGNGGFKCLNSSYCDVIAYGPFQVDALSLQILEPNTKYRLDVIISSERLKERGVVTMRDRICTDMAGNDFRRTNSSVLVVHFDRRPVLADLWTSVPSYQLNINEVPRTVFATNKMSELKFFLNFSIPVLNTTDEVLDAFSVSSGGLISVQDLDNRTHWFAFALKNVTKTGIITIKLNTGLIIGKTGTPVSAVSPLILLYDWVHPGVMLSASSSVLTEEPNINIVIEFTKPVFGFEASMVEVCGGRLARFQELSRALYTLTVFSSAQELVSVKVPAEKVKDISGNPNMESNMLEVKHYLRPPLSTALHSFVTAGTLATSVASVLLSLSAANLERIRTSDSLCTSITSSDPSTNLHGMLGHLQVFVLLDWFIPVSPGEYSETMKGLRWLIPRQKIPWKNQNRPIWPDRFDSAGEKFTYHSMNVSASSNSTESSYKQSEEKFLIKSSDVAYGKSNSSTESSNGLPLNSAEYFTYFLRGEPLSSQNVIRKLENHKGWKDLKMNVFWLGIAGLSFITIRVLLSLFLRCRTGESALGMLSTPQFELLFLILALPCLSQSSAFVIRGGTPWGIVTGALLLAVPAAFILSVCLFHIVAVFSGSFLEYREARNVTEDNISWCRKVFSAVLCRKSTGKWSCREGLPSSTLSCFSILFENQKGPPVYDQNGIGEEIKASGLSRITGCARSFFIIIDLARRAYLGFISGISTRSDRSIQTLSAIVITSAQLVYLFVLKPYTRRGVQVVEAVSLFCEVALFGMAMAFKEVGHIGFIMLALFLIVFVVQLVNAWHALVSFIIKLSDQPENNPSLRLGFRSALKGLTVPCLPRNFWSSSSTLKMEAETRDRRIGSRAESFRAMTASVMPLQCSPPGFGTDATRGGDMKKLREMAKASF